MRHRHRYKIIGTSRINVGEKYPDIWIQVDIICAKCDKVGTVYVYDEYENKIYNQASKGKYFHVPRKCCLNEKVFIEYCNEVPGIRKEYRRV